MSEEILKESYADVVAMIPRLSWEIMDEAQKDELMAKVVLPRYLAVTTDGTKLGPTTWAEILGTTGESIRMRVRRLKEGGLVGRPEEKRNKDDLVRARRLLTEQPELVEEFVESLPAATTIEVARAMVKSAPPITEEHARTSRQAVAPLNRAVNSFAAMGTVQHIEAAADDIHKAVANDGLTPEALGQIETARDGLNEAIEFAKTMTAGGVA